MCWLIFIKSNIFDVNRSCFLSLFEEQKENKSTLFIIHIIFNSPSVIWDLLLVLFVVFLLLFIFIIQRCNSRLINWIYFVGGLERISIIIHSLSSNTKTLFMCRRCLSNRWRCMEIIAINRQNSIVKI